MATRGSPVGVLSSVLSSVPRSPKEMVRASFWKFFNMQDDAAHTVQEGDLLLLTVNAVSAAVADAIANVRTGKNAAPSTGGVKPSHSQTPELPPVDPHTEPTPVPTAPEDVVSTYLPVRRK